MRLVTSHVHPAQPCRPSILCKIVNQSKYFHPKSWKDPSLLERLQEFEPSLCVELHSCICRPCRNELKDITNHQFVPRWRKHKGMTQSCFVPECMNDAQKVTKLADRSTLLNLKMTLVHNLVTKECHCVLNTMEPGIGILIQHINGVKHAVRT